MKNGAVATWENPEPVQAVNWTSPVPAPNETSRPCVNPALTLLQTSIPVLEVVEGVCETSMTHSKVKGNVTALIGKVMNVEAPSKRTPTEPSRIRSPLEYPTVPLYVPLTELLP